MSKNKHLTFEERLYIQESLDKKMTFREIAKWIGKDPTTVSKEVKRHLTLRESSVRTRDEKGNLVETSPCPLLLRAPYVCNACEKRHRSCKYTKQLYFAKHAQQVYEKDLRESREGVALNKEAFYRMDDIVTTCVKQGQHIYHISQAHDLGYSQSSVYRLLDKGYLSCSSTDLPRKVKFRARKKPYVEYVPKARKVGRTYTDFLEYIDQEEITSWVEMDTVIGRQGGKVLLTMDFTICNFMLAFLLDNKTAAEAASKIRSFKTKLRDNGISFGDIFPLVLTDNGGEFSNIDAFELDLNGVQETKLFFCDPMRSCQKPKVEKNHTLFRDIVPKGSSFDSFSQDTIDLIFSHINSISRKRFNGRCPFDIFASLYGPDILDVFGISRIPSNEVIQSPRLLLK
ncbi:MAG: IS30 family transposase [Oscillospiraceae bacterium]|nr:IS30 family transposase [Oscillospiraceae bacterium]